MNKESFDIESLRQTMEMMVEAYGFFCSGETPDFDVLVEDDNQIIVEVKNAGLGKILLYNKGNIARKLREYIASVAETNNRKISFSVKKSF